MVSYELLVHAVRSFFRISRGDGEIVEIFFNVSSFKIVVLICRNHNRCSKLLLTRWQISPFVCEVLTLVMTGPIAPSPF